MVSLPGFRSLSKKDGGDVEKPRAPDSDTSAAPEDNAIGTPAYLAPWQLKRATRTRKMWSFTASFLLFVAVIMLIMVEIGSTHNKSVLTDIWFIKLNLSNVIPESTPNSALINTIAQSLGLHDFYQVGLWGYCEALTEGVTNCSTPQALYWFDPVAIITSELLAGATIQLPESLTSVLDIVRIASHWMFGLFLTGACLSTVLIFLQPLTIYTRWFSFMLWVLNFLNALFITAASVIATVMFVIFRNVFQSEDTVNIGATIGATMFGLMWTASGCAIVAFIIQLSLQCCCATRRDVHRGKKVGNKHAYPDGVPELPKKHKKSKH